MLLNKSFVLAANNWKVMIKALVCQLIILALVVACCFLIFGGVTDDIINVFAAGGWDRFFSDTVKSIADASFNGNDFASELATCIEQTQAAIEAIPNIWNTVEVSYISFFVICLLYRVLISFSDVAVSFQLNEFMTSNAERPFVWFFFKKFWESWAFSLLQTAVTLPLDFLVVLGSTSVCLIFVLTLKWWSIIPALLIFLLLYSARQSYFAFWLPAVATDELKIPQALNKGLSTIPYRFWHVFWKNFVTVVVMAAIAVVGVVFVKNNVLKIVVSVVPNLILFFLLKCVNFVEYFEATHRPYFYRRVEVEGTERFIKREERHKKKK